MTHHGDGSRPYNRNKTAKFYFRHSLVALRSIFKGNNFIKGKYAELRALKSIQSFCENAPQIVLQTYVVIVTWKGFGELFSAFDFIKTSNE